MQKNRNFILIMKSLVAILLIFSAGLTACNKSEKSTVDITEIQQNFVNPEGKADIAVYWYWLNDNISEEGVVKDLEAMKRAGIGRAYIGFQGIDDIPKGKVPFQSEEWWKILRTTLSKAGELGIEIGIFNSPGWSQSGGPWVKPEQSMQFIEIEKIYLKGDGEEQTVTLPEIKDAISDVAVIAYPVNGDGLRSVGEKFNKKSGKPLVAEISFDAPAVARTLVATVATPFRTPAVVEAYIDGAWKLIKNFAVERYNPGNLVGFKPYAPVVIALPETEAKDFRVIVEEGEGDIEFMVTEKPLLEKYAEKSMAKMFQEPLPLWADYMWDAQPGVTSDSLAIKTDEIVNISDKVKNGVLTWTVPDGTWEVCVMKSKSTGVLNTPAMPDAQGLEIDKLDKAAAVAHFDAFIGEILRRIPEQERSSFKYVISDSYEVGGQNWSDSLLVRFKRRYGYDALPYLPTLSGEVVESRDKSDRFLWDLRRFVADCLADEYMTGLREEANKNGLKLWLENYGHWGYTGEFLQYGSRADEVSGEFWSEGNLGDIENKGASSCAHIYGKNLVWSESCTSGVPSFCRYPAIMKQRVDRFFTEGINATLLHLYIQQPDDRQPGIAAWFGNEFNRNNVWFDQLDVFLTYLKRCNYMLRQGQYVADAAYFIGEDAPKMTGICDPEIPYGYSFDYINAEVLLKHAKVKKSRLVLDSGMEYSVLVLPKQSTMRPELLSKIKEFVRQGLTITGSKPLSSPSLENYPAADESVKAAGEELWKDETAPVKFGKGTVYPYGTPLETIFSNIGVKPDFSVSENQVKPLFIHRDLGNAQVYFIANQQDSVIRISTTYRVGDNLQPQIWDAVTGEISALPEFVRNSDGTISIGEIEMQPLASAFIVFRKDAGATDATRNIPTETVVAEISNPWNVTFEKERRGPSDKIVMEKLVPLNEHPDDSVRFYSGKTLYESTFNIGQDIPENLYIDLGKVMVIGKVKINGQFAGGVWTKPYRLNISKFVKPGENTIEVETVNNWKNRLIKDSSLPENRRLTWTNQQNYSPSDTLQCSGIIGPVKLITLSAK